MYAVRIFVYTTLNNACNVLITQMDSVFELLICLEERTHGN